MTTLEEKLAHAEPEDRSKRFGPLTVTELSEGEHVVAPTPGHQMGSAPDDDVVAERNLPVKGARNQKHKRNWDYPSPVTGTWTRVWRCDTCGCNFTEKHLAETNFAYAECSECDEGKVIDTTDPPTQCCSGSYWQVKPFDVLLPCIHCVEDWKDPNDCLLGIVLDDDTLYLRQQDENL